ncbi:MAG: hypothetical protein U1E30_04760 [Rhodoblastus sp.]
MFLRSILIVGAGASVMLDEATAVCAPDATQANEGLTILVGDGARVDYAAQLAEQSAESVALHSLFVTMGANATFNAFCLTPCAGLVQPDFRAAQWRTFHHFACGPVAVAR